tara:strand:+ start:423 stop:1016 length:594 start_codon:yes stop_codon:yes gene_type:complete
VDFLTKKILLSVFLITGCSTINSYTSIYDSFKDTFLVSTINKDDFLNFYPTKNKIILSINDNDEFLAYETNENIWVSSKDIKLNLINGKLIKFEGKESNFELVNFQKIKTDHSAYINFKDPNSGYLEINFSYKIIDSGSLYLRTLDKKISYQLIREDFNVDLISWSGTNFYWIDGDNNIIMSEQFISTFGDKLKITK